MKGKVVDVFRVAPFKEDIEIRLDKKTLEFFASVGGDVLMSKDGEVLRRCIREKVKAICDVAWSPIIMIKYSHSVEGELTASIALEFDRFYYAKLGDENYRQISWSEYEELREEGRSGGDLVTGSTKFHTGPIDDEGAHFDQQRVLIYRPYSDELWQGLERLKEAIDKANLRMMELLCTDKGIARLMSGGKIALSANNE